jgi:hypothetical protein
VAQVVEYLTSKLMALIQSQYRQKIKIKKLNLSRRQKSDD